MFAPFLVLYDIEEVQPVEYSFNYSFLKNGTPIVTLSSLGLPFNKGAIDMLGAPSEVVVGYDEQQHAIGIHAATEEASELPRYGFSTRVRNDWVRIGAKDFVRYLNAVTKIDFISKAKQFIPEYDQETNTLVIVVDEAHLK